MSYYCTFGHDLDYFAAYEDTDATERDAFATNSISIPFASSA